MAWYGWLGALVLLVDQALLPWQITFLARWFTPVMWTAYILLADAWVLRRDGRSLLHDRPREAAFMATVSIPLWLIFEGYNMRLQNWAYFEVPESPWVAAVAYAWAFATIWPGIFETAALLGAGPLPTPATRREPLPPSAGLRLAMVVGSVFVIAPPLLPAAVRPWTFGFVWLGFVLLLDPLNALAGRPSFLASWRSGDRQFVWRWLVAGVVCGVLWEFWNYWALAKWRYVGVPVFPSVRLFEMPLAGYLGFPPFALEVFAMYHLVRPLAGALDRNPQAQEPGASRPPVDCQQAANRLIDHSPTEATRGGRRNRGKEGSAALGDEEGSEQASQGGSEARRQGSGEDARKGSAEGGLAGQASGCTVAPGTGPDRSQSDGPGRAPARPDPAKQTHPSGPVDLRRQGTWVGRARASARGAGRWQGQHPGSPADARGAGRGASGGPRLPGGAPPLLS